MSARLSAEDTTSSLAAAAEGDSEAWERIVASYAGLVWSVTRQHGLTGADAADVSETVWLRLVESLERIEDPSRLGGWLSTTSTRECLRVVARSHRQVPVTEPDLPDRSERDVPPLDTSLLRGERAAEVRDALAQLPTRCQRLLHLLMQDPPPSYELISSTLNMPIGSIGPTRARCLRRLQQVMEQNDLEASAGIQSSASSVFEERG
jgi:RNA polymerase sigma factor (sigma-70 family)